MKRLLAGLVVLVAVLALGGPAEARPGGVDPAGDADEALRQQVADTQHLAVGDLVVVDRATRTYPLTGVRTKIAKVLHKATGRAYLIGRDSQGGVVDPDNVASAEQRARDARFGKIDPRLQARLDALPAYVSLLAPASSRLPVSIWLRTSDVPLIAPDTPDAAEAAATVSTRLATVKQQTAPGKRAVIDRLAALGARARSAEYAPLVFTSLNRAQLAAIAQLPDVVAIYGPESRRLTLDDAGTTARVYRAWSTGNLGSSAASRPVVHEPDGVADFNRYLNNATHPVVFWCPEASSFCTSGKNVGDHASAVAGVIASTHPLYRGFAPSAQAILSANSQDFSDANVVAAFEWARANGGDPTNMSWSTECGGFQDAMSRYVDWAIRHLRATFVLSAGNFPSPAGCPDYIDDTKVGSPGVAWGAITVGAYLDKNDGFWSNDFVSGFSSWRNPDFAPGMEKPEVVAVGQDVRTTDAQPGDGITQGGASGTSLSAPQVAGQVALIEARRPGQNQWPETNKAIVLASAWHDVEPGQDRDGVGGIVVSSSDDTARQKRFMNDSRGGLPLTAADFPRGKIGVLSLRAEQRVRVAIAWDSDADAGTSDVLGADLDLRVRRSDDGSEACASRSLENAWELCDFVAPSTGLYDILVDLASVEPDWPGTYLGIAWSIRGTVPNACTDAIPVPETGGTFTVDTSNGPTFFDAYPGWSFNQMSREQVLRLKLSSRRSILVTDSRKVMDVHILRIDDCAADPLAPTVLASGEDAAALPDADPGTYYVVVDGRNRVVESDDITVRFAVP